MQQSRGSCQMFQLKYLENCFNNNIKLVGLVTLDEMKAKQEDVIKKREKQLAKKDAESRFIEKQKEDRKRKEKLKVCISRSVTFVFEKSITLILNL